MTTRWFMDTEFVDDSRTLDLISIGLVREDGQRRYYAVNADEAIMDRAVWHDWLRANVVKHLPVVMQMDPNEKVTIGASGRYRHKVTGWEWSDMHPEAQAIKPKKMIAMQIQRMLTLESDGPPELWAWYSAYDHVVFAQLFGTMMDLPHGFPMLTRDLKDWALRLGDPRVPVHPGREHHAFDDAAHDLIIYESLKARQAETPQ